MGKCFLHQQLGEAKGKLFRLGRTERNALNFKHVELEMRVESPSGEAQVGLA